MQVFTLGGALVGILIGSVLLLWGTKRNQKGLAQAGFYCCVFVSSIGGLILGIPTAVIFCFLIVSADKKAQPGLPGKGDDGFYGLAAQEITDQRFVHALMAKAYSLALGDAAKTRALYIAMRAEQLKEERELASAREAAGREANAREGEAAQKRRQAELAAERRRREEAQAQRMGDAWSRSEFMTDGWGSAAASGRPEGTAVPTPPTPGPPLSLEELDKIIESQKAFLARGGPKQ
jgi:hypothetical protein